MSPCTTAHAMWRRAFLTLAVASVALAALTVPATAATAHDHQDSAYTAPYGSPLPGAGPSTEMPVAAKSSPVQSTGYPVRSASA